MCQGLFLADPCFSLAALTALAQGGLGGGVWGCGIPNLGTALRLSGLSTGWEGASSWTGWGETPWDHPAAWQLTGPGRGWAGAGGCAQAACQDAPIWKGCPFHSRVAPLLFRMLPGFCGLIGLSETERGPVAAGQGAREQGKACCKGSLCWLPGGVLGKKSLWSAYAWELGQESSHITSHWAVFSGC